MKKQLITGADLKADNGSGYNLAGTFPARRFHDHVVYVIFFNGVRADRSNIVSIVRARKGWAS